MVGLAYISNQKYPTEHLGTASLKAYLEKNNIRTSLNLLSITMDEETIVNELGERAVYGFPLFNTNAEKIYSVAKALKDKYPTCLIFTGGPMSTLAHDLILKDCPYIDFIVLGDGEVPLLEAVRAIIKNENIDGIDSIITRTSGQKVPAVAPIDDVPWVSRDYLRILINQGIKDAKVYASRGCCANCSFCSFNICYRKADKPRWYGRSMKSVYEEIINIYENYGIRRFTFVDGSFEDPGELGKKRISEFCDFILSQPIKFTFWCWMRAETFSEKDAELLKKMRKAGFIEVYIGFEANNKQDLEIYNKRSTITDNHNAIKLFRKFGFKVEYGFIMLNPYSTPESLEQNYEFLAETLATDTTLYTNRLLAFWGTDIYLKLQSDGLLLSDNSYLNPEAYRYVDSFAEQVCKFIKTQYMGSNFRDKEVNFQIFDKNFNIVRNVYPEDAAMFVDDFQTLQQKIAYEIASFFAIIYKKRDLNDARVKLEKTGFRLMELYNDCWKLQMKLYRNKRVFNLLHAKPNQCNT